MTTFLRLNCPAKAPTKIVHLPFSLTLKPRAHIYQHISSGYTRNYMETLWVTYRTHLFVFISSELVHVIAQFPSKRAHNLAPSVRGLLSSSIFKGRQGRLPVGRSIVKELFRVSTNITYHVSTSRLYPSNSLFDGRPGLLLVTELGQ
jgi:hypothetical protein